jgi:hypothetical protein
VYQGGTYKVLTGMTTPSQGDIEAPDAPNASAQLFAVTAPAELALGTDRTGSTSFTITNLTGRPVKIRLIPRGRAGAQDTWLSVVGGNEVPMAVGATITATIQVRVPPDVSAGSYRFVLEVVPEDNTESVTGQSVAFTVPAPVVTGRRIPWWILIAAAVGMTLIIGLLVLLLIRGDGTGQPGPGPTSVVSTPPPPIVVPDFIYFRVGVAYANALAIGLKPLGRPADESCGEPRVINQSIAPGERVGPETPIIFSVTYAPQYCFRPTPFPSHR